MSTVMNNNLEIKALTNEVKTLSRKYDALAQSIGGLRDAVVSLKQSVENGKNGRELITVLTTLCEKISTNNQLRQHGG